MKETCCYCGITTDDWLRNPVDENEFLCPDCYIDEFTKRCPICENYIEFEKFADAFLLGRKLANDIGMKSGLYKIVYYPFCFGNCLTGFDGFFDHAIEWIKEFEIKHFDGAEIICKDCFEYIINKKLTLL